MSRFIVEFPLQGELEIEIEADDEIDAEELAKDKGEMILNIIEDQFESVSTIDYKPFSKAYITEL